MTLQRSSLLVGFMLSSVHLAISQGEYLYKGESGIGTSLAFAASNKITSVDLTVGYCFLGVIDLDFGYAQLRSSAVSGFRGTSISPSLTFYTSKQQPEGRKATVGLFISYTYIKYDRAYYWTSREDAVVLGFAVAREITIYDSWFIQPMPAVSYVSSTNGGLAATLGLALGNRFPGGHVLALSPTVGYKATVFSYGASLSFVY